MKNQAKKIIDENSKINIINSLFWNAYISFYMKEHNGRFGIGSRGSERGLKHIEAKEEFIQYCLEKKYIDTDSNFPLMEIGRKGREIYVPEYVAVRPNDFYVDHIGGVPGWVYGRRNFN